MAWIVWSWQTARSSLVVEMRTCSSGGLRRVPPEKCSWSRTCYTHLIESVFEAKHVSVFAFVGKSRQSLWCTFGSPKCSCTSRVISTIPSHPRILSTPQDCPQIHLGSSITSLCYEASSTWLFCGLWSGTIRAFCKQPPKDEQPLGVEPAMLSLGLPRA